MKKEVIIAILVGLTMGLIITFGIYRVTSSITEKPLTDLNTQNLETEATATPTVLALHNPEDGTVQTETELTVTGTTIANSFIVVFVNNEDYISNSDESGNFAIKVTLSQGENIIRVHVLDQEGSATVEERVVVVSDAFEKLEAVQKELEAQNATASGTTSDTQESGESNE